MSEITILAPISLGELVDKLSILDIKLENVKNDEQAINIGVERDYLKSLLDQYDFVIDPAFKKLQDEVIEINRHMWQLEVTVHDCIYRKDFGEVFVEASKDIPFTNDRRARVKKKINQMFNSIIVEEKIYEHF